MPRDTTRLKFGAQRGVEYSYDSTDPYYVQTAFNVEFAQQIFGPVDFVARVGRARLDYRSQTDVVLTGAESSGRSELVRRFSHLRILSAVLKSPTESPFLFPRIGGLNCKDSFSSVATHCI